MNAASLSAPAIRQAYDQFGSWLLGHAGPQRAALKINRFLEFFVVIDHQWQRLPDANMLITHFGAEGLRRFRLPMKWLSEHHQIDVSSEAKEETSEHRRIASIVASLPAGSVASDVLIRYEKLLAGRKRLKNLSLRSIRLALRPAAALLLLEDRRGTQLPSQTTLDRYIGDTPGQRAAITGFINFLGRECGWILELRLNEKLALQRRRTRLEAEIAKLARRGKLDEDERKQWVKLALQYFHGLKAKDANAVKVPTDTKEVDNGWSIQMRGNAYWIPRLPDGTTNVGASLQDASHKFKAQGV